VNAAGQPWFGIFFPENYRPFWAKIRVDGVEPADEVPHDHNII